MSISEGGVSPECREKFDHLKRILRGYGDVTLAFSGGVDSAFLLAGAKAAGLDRVLAVTVVSQFFTQREEKRAQDLALELEVEHVCMDFDILGCVDVIRNDSRRCYFCKRHSFSIIKQIAAGQGIVSLIHGINVDDLGDYRPGIEAAKELGFKAPLVEAGFSKLEIRRCSRALGLGVWDLPSQSCLATRIPMGESITLEQLGMVERAEAMLAQMGLGQVRVRCHGTLARIEISLDEFSKILANDVRESVYAALIEMGFSFVSLDLGGYESGKMNVPKKRAGVNEVFPGRIRADFSHPPGRRWCNS